VHPIDFLYPTALVAVPLVTYLALVRRPGITRRQVLAGCTLAGAAVGIGAGVLLLLDGAPVEGIASFWPWILISGTVGGAIGLLGLLARGAGGWLSGPP